MTWDPTTDPACVTAADLLAAAMLGVDSQHLNRSASEDERTYTYRRSP